jgi:hypothetical protein
MAADESPLEKAKDHARDADRVLDQVTRDLAFADEIESVTKRRAGIGKLQEELARARTRGWVWGGGWEASMAGLAELGARSTAEVSNNASIGTARFRTQLDQVRGRLSRTAVTAANRAALGQLEDDANDLKRAVDAEQSKLQALAKPFVDAFDGLQKEIVDAHKHLDRFQSARFQLQAGENPYRTSECTWQDCPQGTVNGFLYLTDKRVRFEQKETVTTKKFLFFTASSEDKHELLLDEPVGNIARSDDSTKGLVFKDQLVTLTWQGARIQKSTFDINSGETAKDWDTWIEELRSGQLAHRMMKPGAGGPGAAAPPPTMGMPVNAPTKCSACDASLDAPVRGVTVLVCKYCGQRHDLQFA